MVSHWKFLGRGGGVLKAKQLEAKYDAKLEFPGGGCKTKTFCGGSMDIFSGANHLQGVNFSLWRPNLEN